MAIRVARNQGCLRRWCSRVVVAAAALAAVATGAPHWQLEAQLPGGAVTTTPPGGSQAIILAVDASESPEATCELDGASLPLVPLEVVATADTGIVHAQFVCPPGGQIRAPRLSGAGGGGLCHGAEPPEEAFVRVSRLAAVSIWTRTAEGTITLHDSSTVPRQLEASTRIRSRYQAVIEVEPESDADPHAFGPLRTLAIAGNRYEIRAPSLVNEPGHVHVRVHATVYGACPTSGTCAAPEDADEIVVEEGP